MYKQDQNSVLFITLDSCRYDTFIQANIPNLKNIGQIYKTKAPSYFTYASHHAMFVGFTPSIAEDFTPLINAKYGKIFRMGGSAGFSKENDYLILEGKNIIEGFKRLNYLTIGSGAVGWFNPETETAQSLIQDFDLFYYPGDTYSLKKQLHWIESQLSLIQDKKVFLFLNIGETHTPYYHEGASWSSEYNPCIPFGENNDTEECRKRQTACLEYVDLYLKPLLEAFKDSNIIICADHGDCWGEDGLWEHGFHHEKVLEVPLIFQLSQDFS
ncbi:sulfatase-like hydrolase/transferase [Geminocystis herdmanii]|uniref:sulfatase-like hydrolase/transferase n=1 Tax=Geminocystis herdmanii TaxID=669359 RepID=UPI000348D4F8|nr:sulfatase-like hydrolase/transferase [Geminocystis herdmanii]